MKRIVYYISDVGWGHAARSVVIIKALKRAGNYGFIVVNSSAQNFLKRELEEEIIIESPKPTEPGWGGRYLINKEILKKTVFPWAESLKEGAQKEADRIGRFKPDLIVCDVNPIAPLVAERLGVPCVSISNFNWWDEYRIILGEEAPLEPVKEAYEKCTWSFILPLESENRAFRLKERVELVAKDHYPDSVRRIRRDLIRTYKPELIAMVAAGGWKIPIPETVVRAIKEASRKAKILWIIPQRLHLSDTDGLLIHRIPENGDFRNTLAACDFIISKYGYSTASEALISNVPMILTYRPEVPEDSFATEDLVMSGCALRYSYHESFSIPLESIWELKCQGLSKRMANRGAERIVRRIQERFL